MPVKRARLFSVYNWHVASCEYKQYIYCFAERIYREEVIQFYENMKKYNQDNAITQIRKGSQFYENIKKYDEDNAITQIRKGSQFDEI